MRAYSVRALIGRLIAATVVLIGLVPPSWAQFRITNGKAEQTANIFLPAPRDLRQQLSRAKKALDDQQYAVAVDLLGRLLATSDAALRTDDERLDQDFFLGEPGQEGTRTSLKAEAQRLLDMMPPKGRELYELKFGTEAKRLLDSAATDGDIRQLKQVTRCYFHTQAGYEATMLLGRYELDQGRPLAAALCFQRLIRSALAQRQYDPELALLLAAAWRLSGQPQRASDTLVSLKKRLPQARVRVAGHEMSLFGERDEPLQWLDTAIGKGLTARDAAAVEWVMFRGEADRNATSHAGFPLLNVRWRVRVANHPTDEELIRLSQQRYWDQGQPAICSLQPLAVANVLLMRTPRRLIAVDFATGKRIWDFPWFESSEDLDPRSTSGARNVVLSTRERELQQRVWEDAAYGQMSSDGKRVFLLWQLGFADPGARRSGAILMPRGRLATNPSAPRDTNKLVALDLRQEGKLQWIVGGSDGTDEPKLAGAFFLGPPLPLMDRLYVLAEVNSELRLVVLAAQSGRLLWDQQLASVDSRRILVDASRRLAGASPSYSDGVLVCPTSAGAVVAVDIATRSLLWGYQYPQASMPTNVMMNAMRFPMRQIGQRWADATVTIADGKVLLTPVESDYLYCLDLLTGKELWKPRPRNGMLYLACVRHGQAVLVGKDKVVAVALKDGADRWTLPLEDGIPSGRGMPTEDAYFLATTGQQLLKIDLKSGKLLRKSHTDVVLGNLLAYRDQIISQSAQWLAAYYQSEPLRGIIADRMKQNPGDVWALARQAELLLYDGKRREAVAVLRRARKLAPDDDMIHTLLVDSIVAALREDFAANRALAADLESMIEQPPQRLEYYRLMADGLQQVGQYAEALEYYVKFAGLEPTAPGRIAVSAESLLTVSPQLRVSRDRWVRMQLTRMLGALTPAQRTPIEAKIDQHMKQIIALENPKILARFVEHFAASARASGARLQLAKQLMKREDWLAAEQQLITLQDVPDAAVAAHATWLLGGMLQQLGRMDEAAACYRLMAQRWPDAELPGGKTVAAVVAAARADTALKQHFANESAWPYGACEVQQGPTGARPFTSFQRVYNVALTNVRPPFPQHAKLAYNYNLNSLMVTDQFGHTLQQLLLGDQNRFYTSYYAANHGTARGHLILASIGFEVLAVDTLRSPEDSTDPILWRRDLSNKISVAGQRSLMANTITRSWGPPRVLPRDRSRQPIGLLGPVTAAGVIYQKLHEVICADPVSNAIHWRRSGIAPGSDLFGDDQYLFVVEPDAHVATVLHTADGTEVDQREVGQRVSRWITRGRRVLDCRVQSGKLTLRWYDAWQQKSVWQQDFESSAQCWQVDQNTVAVLERSGLLSLFDLTTAKVRFTAQLQKEPRLARLYVVPAADGYLVVASQQTGSSVSSSVTGTRIYGISTTDQCPLIDGHIYAVDRNTGELQWPAPALIRQFALPLNQPIGAPALTFFRHISQRRAGAVPSSRPTTAAVLCIDKRDGRQLLSADELAMIQYYSIEADPETHHVTIATNAKTFTLTFTDKTIQDAKPLQQEDPTAAINALMEVGRIAGSIMQAVSRANEVKSGKTTPPGKRPPAAQPPKPAAGDKTAKTPAAKPGQPIPASKAPQGKPKK